MKRLIFLVGALLMLSGCGAAEKDSSSDIQNVSSQEASSVQIITQEQAKQIIDTIPDIVILDVRTQEEYDLGHIKGAELIPYDEIKSEVQTTIPDKNKQILVYCRSGRRSKIAAETLCEMGYQNVSDFGGITEWKYGLTK